MSSSSRSLVLIVAGATTVAAMLGVTLGAMQSQKPQPTVSTETIAPNVTLSQTPQPGVSAIAARTVSPQPTDSSVASLTPSSEGAAPKSLRVEKCSAPNMAIVADSNPPLNVRSSPSTASNIVGRLQNGTRVAIVGERNGWLEIDNPAQGWIAKNRTQTSCTEMRVRVTLPSRSNSMTVSDRLVGGGEHYYLIRANKGQTMTVTGNKSIFPTITAPDARVLAGDPYTDANRTRWTGRLPLSGDYTLAFESNGAGFEYGFTVQIR